MKKKGSSAKKLIFKIFDVLYDNGSDYEIKLLPKMRGCKLGECDSSSIKISVSRAIRSLDGLPASPAVTLIHEILHALDNDDTYSEKEITHLTKIAWENLTPLQKLSLYEFLFENDLP